MLDSQRFGLLGSPAPWLLVGLFAMLAVLAAQVGLIGIPLLLVLGSWFLKYAFMVFDHAAEGRPGAPVLTVEAANPLGETRPLLLGAIALVFWFLTASIGDVLGQQARTVLRTVGLLAVPAVVATHYLSGSLAGALDPRLWFELVRRMGGRYLLVVAFAVAAGGIGRAIVLQQDGLQVAPVLRLSAVAMLWLLCFAVLGHAMHARRQEIGFEPEHSTERSLGKRHLHRDRERDRLIDTLFAETRARGAADTAWQTLQRHATSGADPLDEYAWMFQRLAGWDDTRLAQRLAREELLPRLLQRRRTGEALGVLRRCLEANADFRPADSGQLLRLVELARDAGERSLARRLLHDFERHFPGDPSGAAAARLRDQLGGDPT